MKCCIGRFFVSHIYQNLQNRWHILFRDARTVILSYPQPFISHLINRRLPVCILFGSFSSFSFIYKYIIQYFNTFCEVFKIFFLSKGFSTQTQSHTTVCWQAFDPQLYIECETKYTDTCVPTAPVFLQNNYQYGILSMNRTPQGISLSSGSGWLNTYNAHLHIYIDKIILQQHKCCLD